MEPQSNQSENHKGLRKHSIKLSILIIASLFLNGCGVIEGIFQAGFWLGIILSIVIVILLIWVAIKIYQKLK